MDISEVVTNLSAAEDGIFFPISSDCKVKIAHWMNKAHRKFIRELYAKHGRKIDAGVISDDKADELLIPQWQYVVKDWEGLTENGKPLQYSKENLFRLASDKRLSSFFDRIANIAKDEANFRETNIEDLGEELPTS